MNIKTKLLMLLAGLPENIESDFVSRLMAAAAKYPEAYAMYQEGVKASNELSQTRTQLEGIRKQAYGDVLYKSNSTKTTGVIIMTTKL